jgi:hypothetical protein
MGYTFRFFAKPCKRVVWTLWKASSVMEERFRFVTRLPGRALADVCRDFGVSRNSSYYGWRDRRSFVRLNQAMAIFIAGTTVVGCQILRRSQGQHALFGAGGWDRCISHDCGSDLGATGGRHAGSYLLRRNFSRRENRWLYSSRKGYDERPVLIVPEDDPVQSKNGPEAKLAGSPSEGTQQHPATERPREALDMKCPAVRRIMGRLDSQP